RSSHPADACEGAAKYGAETGTRSERSGLRRPRRRPGSSQAFPRTTVALPAQLRTTSRPESPREACVGAYLTAPPAHARPGARSFDAHAFGLGCSRGVCNGVAGRPGADAYLPARVCSPSAQWPTTTARWYAV